jgi:hypothetical protein
MLHLVTHGTDSSKMVYLNARVKNLATKAWSGFKDKLVAMREFLATLPPDDVVCFVDGYDVTCFFDSTEALEKFKAFGVDVLFSAETSCYPWSHVQQLYPSTGSIYRYLNSGGYMGYVAALQQVLSYDMSASPCDQGYMTYYYLNHVHDKNATFKMDLDRGCVIFQSAYAIPWSHFLIKEGRLYNKVTNTQPCFLHYNGQQHLMKGGESIMPIVYALAQERGTKELGDYEKLHDVVCDAQGRPLGSQGSPLGSLVGRRDADIIALATERARRYVAPSARIVERDQVNYHAILQGSHFIGHVTEKTENVAFVETNRAIICAFLQHIKMPPRLFDLSLHDYVGPQMNTREWPHSILSFSTSKSDTHNLLIPDLYAMQDYKGALNKKDTIPMRNKVNKLLFIGVSSGTALFETNRRVAMCRYVETLRSASRSLPPHTPVPSSSDWIEAYLSGIVNFSPRASTYLQKFLHAPMTQEEQYGYRHIMVIDGNTACWDRLPWVLASQCVCWKEESNDQCWYYEFLKPWVHYVPFTRETLEDTWKKVKNDVALQERIVHAANAFVEDFLRHGRHVLYLQTLVDQIAALSV